MVLFRRHLAKAITYRVLGTGATVGAALAMGVEVEVAGLIGAGELVLKPLMYLAHERAWYALSSYGIKKP